MPYLLLLAGLALALAALYRFFLKASPREVKAALLAACAIGIGLAAFFFAFTGRLPAAVAILLALWPVIVSYLRTRPASQPADESLPLSRVEAYEVLGLPEGAGPDEIKQAHMRLMKKLHPDQAGSDWLAKKINAAKDLLVNSEPKA